MSGYEICDALLHDEGMQCVKPDCGIDLRDRRVANLPPTSYISTGLGDQTPNATPTVYVLWWS